MKKRVRYKPQKTCNECGGLHFGSLICPYLSDDPCGHIRAHKQGLKEDNGMKVNSEKDILAFEQKNARNRRVQNRYDELMKIGENGHYETMFRVVHEEIELALRMKT